MDLAGVRALEEAFAEAERRAAPAGAAAGSAIPEDWAGWADRLARTVEDAFAETERRSAFEEERRQAFARLAARSEALQAEHAAMTDRAFAEWKHNAAHRDRALRLYEVTQAAARRRWPQAFPGTLAASVPRTAGPVLW